MFTLNTYWYINWHSSTDIYRQVFVVIQMQMWFDFVPIGVLYLFIQTSMAFIIKLSYFTKLNTINNFTYTNSERRKGWLANNVTDETIYNHFNEKIYFAKARYFVAHYRYSGQCEIKQIWIYNFANNDFKIR